MFTVIGRPKRFGVRGSESKFIVIGPVTQIETIAEGSSIRSLADLHAPYGGKHWRKLKGVANVESVDGSRS